MLPSVFDNGAKLQWKSKKQQFCADFCISERAKLKWNGQKDKIIYSSVVRRLYLRTWQTYNGRARERSSVLSSVLQNGAKVRWTSQRKNFCAVLCISELGKVTTEEPDKEVLRCFQYIRTGQSYDGKTRSRSNSVICLTFQKGAKATMREPEVDVLCCLLYFRTEQS